MSCLSQEIVDYLNHANIRNSLGDWLEQNPVIHNYVTCPYISIRPTAMPTAQRITAYDGPRGRFIDILYKDGSHRYVINVSNWSLTVEHIETFMWAIERVAGSCHVERSFLLLFVPAGYSLEITGVDTIRKLQVRQLEATDIGLNECEV
jgi:hypothetical protein